MARNILLFTSTFPRSQDDPLTPRFVYHLGRELLRRHNVHVLAPHAPGAAMEGTSGGVAAAGACGGVGAGGSGGGNWVTGDLSNDVFYPFVRFVDDFRMRVFNRWGELVFESHDVNDGWDGTYKGIDQPIGVYVYTAVVHTYDGEEHILKGDVSLIR